MTPNIGTARLRYDYDRKKINTCLNCKLADCVHDEPGHGNDDRCPLNKSKAQKRKEKS